MHYLSTFVAILAFLFWGGLFVVYYREHIFPWIINMFTRDKPPKKSETDSLLDSSPSFSLRYDAHSREKEIKRIEEKIQREKENGKC